MKKALITGIAGQDGSYLSEFLLEKGYRVFGIDQEDVIRDPGRLWRIKHLLGKVELISGTIEDHMRVSTVIREIVPDECYHLAARSYVDFSFDDVFSIMNTNFHGTHAVLSSLAEFAPDCRLYFAGSSEMFGEAPHAPQNESTPFNPRSAYGISKVAAFYLVKNFRLRHNLFACAGIAYNHESERRGIEFVTRKITSTAARIKLGYSNELRLGNLDAKRDWGYSPDYVRAMWLMLQRPEPEDFILATGNAHSVRDFVAKAFELLDLNWESYVVTDSKYFRPSEEIDLVGQASKAHEKLSWVPEVSFDKLVEIMINHDFQEISKLN